MSSIELLDGYKYALLALPRLNADTRGAPLIVAEEGYALSSDLPVKEIKNWRKTFGWYRFRNLSKAGHYLIVYAPSKEPGILNEENQGLEHDLHYFHLGVTIGCPFVGHEESVFLEGARRNGVTEIRGHTTYPQLTRIGGGPTPYLREPQLKYALELGRYARTIRNTTSGPRFGRVLSAFRAGLQQASLDSRVHQFVRCIEAFVGSWRKEEFAANSLELVSGVDESELIQAYEIRSAVEHFGGWQRAINVRGQGAKEMILILRAMQMQAAAHLLIARFLERPDLWEGYVDERSVKGLRKLPADERANLWGPRISVSSIREVNLKRARAAMLRHS